MVDLQTMTASLAVNDRSEFGNMLDRRGFDARIRSHTDCAATLPADSRAILLRIRGLRAGTLALTAN